MSIIRRLEEETDCRWFLKCDRQTDATLDHPVLGQVPICTRCLDVIEADRQIAGWRFTVTLIEHGETKEESHHFLSPLRAIAESHVRQNVHRWHPQAAILACEWTESIPPNQGWGKGAWTESFKKEESAQ